MNANRIAIKMLASNDSKCRVSLRLFHGFRLKTVIKSFAHVEQYLIEEEMSPI
jgi:hypothetical protein